MRFFRMCECFFSMLHRFLCMLQGFLGVGIVTALNGFLQMLDRFLFVRNSLLGVLDDFLHMPAFARRRRTCEPARK